MSSVYTDKRTGSVVVRAYAGRDPATGRPRSISRSLPAGATEEEVAAARADVELRAGAARGNGGRYTVRDMVEYYLAGAAAYGMSPTTVESYRSMARRHVYPHVGGIPLDRAEPADFSRLYRMLLERGGEGGAPLAATTVRKLHAMLSGCFSTLVRDGVAEANPVAGVRAPRGQSPEARPLSPEDFGRLLALLRREVAEPQSAEGWFGTRNLAACVWAVLHTGVRRGEACGLRRCDVLRGGRELRVSRSLAEVRGGLVAKEPKSARGKRTLGLDEATRGVVLARMAASSGAASDAGAPLFGHADGSPLRPSELTAGFRAMAERAGVGRYAHLHTLRHTHATYLLDRGVNVRTVQERLGHSKIDVTLGIYGHVLPGRDEAAAEGFGEASAEAMQRACDEGGVVLGGICPLTGETCGKLGGSPGKGNARDGDGR